MLASDIPVKFPIPWADAAGAGFIRPIPTDSQIGIQAGAASLTDGFPPLNFTPVAASGVPPFGQDANGILQRITQWEQWAQAGGPVPYDAAFQTAIGGYPAGAVVGSLVWPGSSGVPMTTLRYYSTVDNNLSNPDTGGGGWVPLRARLYGALTLWVSASGNDANTGLLVGSPWQTILKAWNWLQQNLDLNGFAITVNCAGAFTAGLTASGAIVGATSPASVTFAGGGTASVTVASGSCFILFSGTAFTITGFTLLAAAGSAFEVHNGSELFHGGNTFGTCGEPHLLCIDSGSHIDATSAYTISGSAPNHINSELGSTAQCTHIAISIIGSLTFTAFASADNCSQQDFNATTFSGGSVTGLKFNVALNAVINHTGSLPGSGFTQATGGQFN